MVTVWLGSESESTWGKLGKPTLGTPNGGLGVWDSGHVGIVLVWQGTFVLCRPIAAPMLYQCHAIFTFSSDKQHSLLTQPQVQFVKLS